MIGGDQEHLAYAEIGERLGCTENAVRKLCVRAVLQLRPARGIPS